jgi:hypothetical protein
VSHKDVRSLHTALTTSKKLKKRKKINDSFGIHQRNEVTGQTATFRIGEKGRPIQRFTPFQNKKILCRCQCQGRKKSEL